MVEYVQTVCSPNITIEKGDTEILYMPKEKKSPTDMQEYVMHLRYRLTQYHINGIAPPVSLLMELKMAERLVKLESMDARRIRVKV